jgi:uncharacterized protein (TIGR00369 family)
MSGPDADRDFWENQIAFNRHLGIRLIARGQGFVRMELPFRPEHIGDPHRSALHGGLFFIFLDIIGGAAVWTELDEGDKISTVDLRVDFLLPAPLETLVCEGRVARKGNRVVVTDMKVFTPGEPDRVIATGKAVYNLRRSDER